MYDEISPSCTRSIATVDFIVSDRHVCKRKMHTASLGTTRLADLSTHICSHIRTSPSDIYNDATVRPMYIISDICIVK